MYDIVRSCLFTIAACVYRAVHPNVPDPDKSFWEKSRVTVKVTFSALIAPELMIWWAMRQRFGANIVAEEVNSINPALKWTQTHGQFAQMGGFARRDTKYVLYPNILIELLKNNQIDVEDLQLTKKEINDKSKGDILSKGLVAFQTAWFVFECLARIQQGLPLIELEVVTLAFATLNAITYGLWWYKPLNVMCPIYIRVLPNPPPPSTPSQLPQLLLIGEGEQGAVEPGQAKASMMSKVKKAVRSAVTMVRDGVKGVINDIKQDLRFDGWWGTAWNWLIVKPFFTVANPLMELVSNDSEEVSSIATYVSTFYAVQISDEKEDRVVMLSCCIGMIFGAIHFVSWGSTFPTHVQLILWRTSSVVMVLQPFLVMLWGFCMTISMRAPRGSWRKTTWDYLAIFVGVISLLGGTIPYIFARVGVLVLAFLTLRDLSLNVFATVSWTTYIPHF